MFKADKIVSRLLKSKHRLKLCYIMTYNKVCDEHSADSERTQQVVYTIQFKIHFFKFTNL